MNLPRSTAVSVALLFSGEGIVHPPLSNPLRFLKSITRT